MEILKETVKIERLIASMNEQALVEGEVEIPGSMQEIAGMLLVQGRVYMGSVEVLDGRMMMEGTVIFNAIYSAVDEKICSYESASSFKHVIDVSEGTVMSRGNVQASIQQIDYSVVDSHKLSVSAVINLSCSITNDETIGLVCGIDDEEVRIQTKRGMVYMPVQKRAMENIRVREDATLDTSCPGIDEIFGRSAYARVKSIRLDIDKVIVEGEAYVNIAYGSQGEYMLQNAIIKVPFGNIIAFDGVDESMDAYVSAQVNEIYVSPIGENAHIVNTEMSISLEVTAVRKEAYSIIRDSYSLSGEIEMQRGAIDNRELAVRGSGKCLITDSLNLSTGLPPIQRVLSVFANPIITSKRASHNRAEIDGVMFLNITYVTQDGLLRAIDTQTVFSGEIDIIGIEEGMDLDVCVDVENAAGAGNGNTVETRITLDTIVFGYRTSQLEFVSDIEWMPPQKTSDGGITIYFAGEGESLWNVAKRYRTTMEIVKKYNPWVNDEMELAEGQKLLLYRP
ncbi:MAG: DUF3794 and LysM peptidoglycan-binding domain-containing protein [Christensenellales bacterium]|jgi:hypothetical protein